MINFVRRWNQRTEIATQRFVRWLGVTSSKFYDWRALREGQRKDHRDIDAMLGSGISLAEGLAAGVAIYGKEFNPLMALKALSYFKDGNLPSLSTEVQDRLLEASSMVKFQPLPHLVPKSGIVRPELQV